MDAFKSTGRFDLLRNRERFLIVHSAHVGNALYSRIGNRLFAGWRAGPFPPWSLGIARVDGEARRPDYGGRPLGLLGA